MGNAVDMDAISRMSVEERFALIAAILNTVDPQTLPFTPDQWDEIQRRLQEDRENPESATNYEDYKARMRSLI